MESLHTRGLCKSCGASGRHSANILKLNMVQDSPIPLPETGVFDSVTAYNL